MHRSADRRRPDLGRNRPSAGAETRWKQRLEPLYGPMDPARYPDRVDPAKILIIEAGKDECVPKSCRDDLWEAMGRPERYIINANHRHAFYTMTPLNLNWMRKKIWDFFEERLLTPEGGIDRIGIAELGAFVAPTHPMNADPVPGSRLCSTR